MNTASFHRMLVLTVCLGLAGYPEASMAQSQGTGAQPAEQPQAATAPAQSVPGPAVDQAEQNRQLAREHYGKGKALFDQSRYDEALVEFQQAYDLSPHPVVLKSVGECQVRTGNIKGAIESFEKYLVEKPDAQDSEEVKSRIGELRSKMGRVDITSIPDGATVEIDGQSTGKTTPLTMDMVPGSHKIALTASGFKPLNKDVTLREGETKALPINFFEEGERVALEPFPGEEKPKETGEQKPKEEGGPDYTGAWVSVGIAGAGIIAGSVFGLVALSDESEYNKKPSKSLADSGEAMALACDISFGVAGAAAVVGLVLFLTADSGDEGKEAPKAGSVEVAPIAGANGAGFAAQVTF